MIDEIELFNIALTQAQIQSIFNAGSEGKCKPTVNQSPSCSGTYSSESEIWPPNHTMKDISINGVIDPDGDVITINVKKILQDEPTKVNPGDPAPDGEGIGKETAKVRAERLGIGDGRVYHIEFNAEDGMGGMCESEVTVSVPHNVGLHALDSGAIFNSTLS